MESKRIAVVDDDPLVRTALERLLRSFGYDASAYASAAEFLDASRQSQFACLILDICMPTMSGVQLYQQLTDRAALLPTIFMSAHEEQLERVEQSLPAVVRCLRKPFGDEELLDAIREVEGNRTEGESVHNK